MSLTLNFLTYPRILGDTKTSAFFHLLNIIKIKIFTFNFIIKIIAHAIFNTNVFKFIILHFYIFVRTAMRFFVFVLTYISHNDSK